MRVFSTILILGSVLSCTDDGGSSADTGPSPVPDSGSAPLDRGVSATDAGSSGAFSGLEGAADVSSTFERLVSEQGVVALGGAVVDRNGLVAAGAAGLRSRTATVAVTMRDRWHLGSDTKAMTAVLAAILVEAGDIAWTTTVVEAFPGFADAIHPASRDVTLVELLTHRAGLATSPPSALWDQLWQNQGLLDAQRRRFAEALLTATPALTPGQQYTYSNSGYIIAGAMLESATGALWEALMRDRLFAPLGMDDCGFGPAATPGRLDAPLGHRGDAPPVPVPSGPQADNPPALGPAGTVHCTLEDWARYVALHLRGAAGDTALLPRAAFARLHADPGQTPGPQGGGYAFGWSVTSRPWAQGTILNHAGSNTLNFAVAWLALDEGRAYLAVTNQGGAPGAQAADAAIGALLGDDPQ